ncbi:MAG: hypothetical protein KDB00_14005, partial [Planctomycetales bacterium]|nr:hypothetical protein [Planctomycetales bacterium]
NDSLTTAGTLIINSDSDPGDGNGTLTVASGAAVNTGNQALFITANDLDFVGTINSGTATTTVTDSDGGGIGLGDTAIVGGLNIQAADFTHVTANGLVLATSGNIVVNNITQPANIGGTTTLNATGLSSSVNFQNNASSFNTLAVNATQSVSVDTTVNSQVGGIAIVAGAQVDVSGGRQIRSAGDGTQLSITAGTISLGSGTSGSETIQNSGTGTISLTASGGNLVLDNHVVGGGSGTTTISAAGTIDEAGDNSTVSLATLGTLVLNASGAIGQSAGPGFAGNGALDVQVGSLLAQTFAPGGIYIRNVGNFTLAGATTASGDIEIQSTGTMSVQGAVTSGVSGDVALDGVKIVFSGTGDVTATSGNIAVTTSSSTGLVVASDTLFKTDQGQVSGQLINASNPFAGTVNTGDALSDSNRDAILNVVLADSQGSNIGVQIDWQEGDVVGPVPSSPPGDPRVQIVQSTVANPSSGSTFVHTYENAPDPANPSANINIALSITELAGGSINLFTANQSILLGTQFSAQTVVLEVSAPILPFFLSLPQTDDNERITQPTVVFVNIPESQRIFVVEAPQVLNNSIGTTKQTDQRYYVLRIVSFGSDGEVKLMQGDQEYRLPDMVDADSEAGFELSQLPELFKRLPDDRYRIYMIEGQTERLVLDFIIRDGQPIEAQDDQTEPGSAREEAEVETLNDEAPMSNAERLGSIPVLSAGSALWAARLVKNQSNPPRHRHGRSRTSPLSRKPA